MISNIVIALIAARTVAGAAINKRFGEPIIEATSCTKGTAASNTIVYQIKESSFTSETVVPSSTLILSSYHVVIPSSAVVSFGYQAGPSSVPALSSPASSASILKEYPPSIVPTSKIPIFSSYGAIIPSSTPVSSASPVVSSTLTSSTWGSTLSSSRVSSSIVSIILVANSSIIPSSITASSAAIPSNITSVSASPSSSLTSSLTPAPQSSGYTVSQPSSSIIQTNTLMTAPSLFSSSLGCVSAVTETVYVTTPVPTTTTDTLTVYTTSTQTITLSGSLSVLPLSSIIPTPTPESSRYPVGQPSSDVISSSLVFTIPEFSIVPNVNSSSSGILFTLVTSGTSSMQPTPSLYTGTTPASYGVNSTGTYSTGTALSASLTLVPIGYGPVITSSFIASLTSSAPTITISTGGYSMATSSIPVTPSSSYIIAPKYNVLSSSTQGYQAATPFSSSTTHTPAVVVVPTSLPTSVSVGYVEALYGAHMYKRDATTVSIGLPVAQTQVSNTYKPNPTPKASSKPTSSTLEPSTNAPKPKPSLKQSAGDEVKTIVVSQDRRCPYPYPGINCGRPVTTTTTMKKAVPASTQNAKKTVSVAWCPYPYPGGKGEAC